MRLFRVVGIGTFSILAILLMSTSGAAASTFSHSSPAPRTGPALLAAPSLKIQYTIRLGKLPSGGALDTRNGNVFVANEKSNDVTVVNATTHSPSTIKVGTSPSDVVYDPNNGNLYVPNLNSSSVSIINGATDKVTATVKLGSGAHPATAQVDSANGNVLVFDNVTFPSNTTVWMIKNSTHAVTKLTLGLGLILIATYSPASKDMYVPNYFSSTVTAISPSGALTNISVPAPPISLVYDPAGKVIVMTLGAVLPSPPSLDWIDAANLVGAATPVPTNVSTFVVGSGLYDPYNGRVYVLGYNVTANQTYAISVAPPAVIAGLTLLGSGSSFFLGFLDPANHDLFYGRLTADNITVLDNSSKVVKTIPTSQPAPLMIYDASTKQMFAAGEVNLTTVSTLYAITSTFAVSKLKVGKFAIPFVYDPTDTYVYVANLGSDTLDIAS